MCKLTSIGTNAPPIPSEMQTSKQELTTSWMLLLLFSLDAMPMFSKIKRMFFFFIGASPCVHRKRFQEMFLNPWGDYKDRIIPVFSTVLPGGSKIIGIQYWFLALSTVHRHFFRFSDSFGGTMYCRWSDLLNWICWWALFWNSFTIYRCCVFAAWWTFDMCCCHQIQKRLMSQMS